MKTTSITIWYRRRASGVRTTLWSMFGTGEGSLGYELLSGTCLVQERGLWGTNRTRNVFGAGEGPLGYEPHSKRVRYRRGVSGVRTALETCSVQERGLCGTNRTPKRVRYKRWASGVRITLRKMFGTGEGLLMYGMLHKTPLVQENGF